MHAKSAEIVAKFWSFGGLQVKQSSLAETHGKRGKCSRLVG
jgi:hypothetical protein